MTPLRERPGRQGFRAIGGFLAIALLIGAVVLLATRGGEGQGGSARGVDPGSVDFVVSGWKTDFSKRSVPLSEIVSGGPPRDGIPPIDEPRFVDVRAADRFLAGREPVIAVETEAGPRAYPLQIMTWHEIVNDRAGSQRLAVTFCPLCNSSIVFDRRVEGETLRFGTTGNLRRSDLVMWDDRTESWWQQVGGEAIVGEMTGTRLRAIPSQILSWDDFMRRFPEGQVLSRETGVQRDYGQNPYVGYDDVDSPPFALDEEQLDDRLAPKERVTSVTLGETPVVYRFSDLERRGVIEDRAGGVPIVVAFKRGVASALDDSTISRGRDTGASAVFDRRLDGRTLSFEPAGEGRFRDARTSSVWDITGRAVSGPLRGRKLERVPHDDQFWFAIAAFFDDVEVFEG